MHLKKLELFGFKSFPAKTAFIFEPGVTAIVGPNGCGKTNVVDAIKWVLGEQSAHALRGSHMDDVIFNGTDVHKPLSMAEASLLLDNQDNSMPLDYSEVMLTRRVYRSGESEYFINKTACRLRDINELFMDTGVGTRAYSLLEQGKVDLILSSKPEDRRFLFDEAAGITKIKMRKREAQRKLESTESNVLRVNDIISEVKRQIGSLQRQVGKAKRYRNLSEELKEMEISLAVEDYRESEKRRGKTVSDVSEARQQVDSVRQEVEKAESDFTEKKSYLSRNEAESNSVWNEIRETEQKIIHSDGRIALLRERVAALSRRKEDASSQMTVLRDKVNSTRDELSNFERRGTEIQKERQQKKEELEHGNRRLEEIAGEAKAKGSELSLVKAQILELASGEAKKRNELASLEAVDKSYSAREKRLKDERAGIREERKKCEDEFLSISGRLDKGKEDLARKKKQLDELEEKIACNRGEFDLLNGEIQSRKNELNSVSSNLKLMEEVTKTYEGYNEGVRLIMRERDSLPGICGVAVELMTVPREFESAIEAALGERAQSVIVKRREDCLKAISYLKEKKGGRATFLPLDLLQSFGREGLENIKSSGVVGIARRLVKYDSEYAAAIELLLGRTLIVDGIENAFRLLPDLPDGWNIVTPAGDFVDRGGFITGGTERSEVAGLIGRSERIHEMNSTVHRLEDTLNELQHKHSDVSRRLDEWSSERRSFREKLHSQEEQLRNLENVHLQLKNELERLTKDISLLGDELEAVKKDRDRLKSEIDEVSVRILAFADDKEKATDWMNGLQEFLDASATEREEISERLTQARVSLASVDEREEALKTSFALREKACSEYQEEIEKLCQEIKESDGRITEFREEIGNLERDLEELEKEKEQLDGRRLKIDEDRKEKISRIDEIEVFLREKREILRNEEEKLHEKEMERAQVEMEASNLLDRMYSRYKVELKVIAGEMQEAAIDRQAMSEEIVRLQTKLEAMGPVNLVAIDEHTELEERHAFLIEQRNDLLSAKESLLKTISRINKQTKSMFLETFQKVNEHFGEVFKTLFEGGKAELILVDEKNVLETGIEIIARPPGKKLQSISLLSGGEKAMTAIALLFAIMKVRPSPFCVLDEIDAPLDDSNIGRFAKLIRERSMSSQFIIVTHNKATIATSDIVHGVTMEERGISKQVSVKFSGIIGK